jgi:hypothetical protein
MGGKGSGTASKLRTGFRGYLIIRSNIEQCLKCSLQPFVQQAGHLSYAPKHLIWPEMDDSEGVQELISAVIDRNLPALKAIQSQYPEYNLGITEYIETLESEDVKRFPGGKRLLSTRPLPRGLRLDVELATDARNITKIRAVIRRGNVEIAAKTLAKKEAN